MDQTKHRGRRRCRVAVITVVALAIALVGVALVGNDYRLRQRQVFIPVTGGALTGVLATPTGTSARGLVVMIHGDGPIDATQNGLYLPLFEAAADAGFATLSWSKPGIGASRGNWLDQSMNDRAAEVSSVIDWAKRQPTIPTNTLVLWGASQAGWVFPTVAATRGDIDAIIAVSPAINWRRQGRFNLLAELDNNNASSSERRHAINRSNHTRVLLAQHASYNTYRATTNDPDPMSARRWAFVAHNDTSDATRGLTAMADKHVPVLLLLGEHDHNVDISETQTTYTALLGADLRVKHFNAAHSMARPAIESSDTLGLIAAALWPRALFASGVLTTYTTYLENT